jgi:hypothetical protein
MGDVWSRLTNVAAHFPHDTNVVVAVEEVILVLSGSRTAARTVRRLVRLEGGIAEDYNESLCIFVVCGNRSVLFGHELR